MDEGWAVEVRLLFIVQVLSYLASAVASLYVLVERLPRAAMTRNLLRRIVQGRLLSSFASSTSVSSSSPPLVEWNFMEDGGLLLLVLDLLAAAFRLGFVLMQEVPGRQRQLRGPYYYGLYGLFAETPWLQGSWLVHVHATINRCLSKKQFPVTGSLARPFLVVLAFWLAVGLGPVLLCQLTGVHESLIRAPVDVAGSVVGVSLMGYLLFTYHRTLKRVGLHDRMQQLSTSTTAFNEEELPPPDTEAAGGNKAASSTSSRRWLLGSSGVMTMTSGVQPGGGGASPLTARVSPAPAPPPPPPPPPTAAAATATAQAADHREGSTVLQRRIRRALSRVLRAYVYVFVCVILAGALAPVDSGSHLLVVLAHLLDLPYSLLGVIDAVLLGGLGRPSGGRITKSVREMIYRRRRREDGRGRKTSTDEGQPRGTDQAASPGTVPGTPPA